MEIIINDEKLDYTIEQEKNLGDVLDSLEWWITENGGVIDHVRVDEKDLPLDRQTDELQKSLTSIGILSLQTLSKFDHALATIKTVGVYIERISSEYLKSRNVEDYELIIEGINLVHEGVIRALSILHLRDMVIVNEKGRSLRELLSELGRMIGLYEKRYVDGDERKELREVLKDIQGILPKVLNWAVLKNSVGDGSGNSLEVYFLKTALGDLEGISRHALKKFEKIGENLQIGRDGEALQDLFFVIELMDEIIFVLQFFLTAYSMESGMLSRSEFSFEKLFEKISTALKEVEMSFASDDLITVGDLLEYEIKPLFEAMIDLLHRIGVFIQ
jgi:hypothetical protein